MFGLKINYGKCEMNGIQIDANMLNAMANIFGYKVGHIPSKYLGLPLCMGVPKRKLWNPVVERIERKLSSWKGRYFSLGGRLTLIKSVLSSIPIYFLSCFKCPTAVVKRIRKFSMTFFGMIQFPTDGWLWMQEIDFGYARGIERWVHLGVCVV